MPFADTDTASATGNAGVDLDSCPSAASTHCRHLEHQPFQGRQVVMCSVIPKATHLGIQDVF